MNHTVNFPKYEFFNFRLKEPERVLLDKLANSMRRTRSDTLRELIFLAARDLEQKNTQSGTK